MPIDESRTFLPVRIAVLTVSDTRGLAEDRSGDTLVARLTEAGHVLADRRIEKDDVETIVVTSMHERKQLMYDQSDAFVVAPGGIGTLEEVVELLSWKRLDLHGKPVIFLNVNGFWETFFALMRQSVDTGFTPPSFLQAWVVCDTVEDAIQAMRHADAAPALKHDQR